MVVFHRVQLLATGVAAGLRVLYRAPLTQSTTAFMPPFVCQVVCACPTPMRGVNENVLDEVIDVDQGPHN